MMVFFSIFSFDFLALDCINVKFKAYYAKVYMWCLLPLVMAVVIVLFGVGRIRRRFTFEDLNKGWRSTSSTMASSYAKRVINQHTWLLLLLSYLVLPAVTNKQLQVFDCIKLRSGERYLRIDTSINCQDEEYYKFRSVVIMFIALYQLIPITWFIILYKHREALMPMSLKYDEKLAMFIRDSNHDLAAFRFLFVDYICPKWWFEIADMYRRIMFIGIIPLCSNDSASRASLGLLLAIISLVYFGRYKPYRVHFTNVIAFVGQVSILVTFYAALTLESDSLVNIGLEGSKLGVFLVLVNLGVVLFALFLAVQNYLRQKRAQERIEMMVCWPLFFPFAHHIIANLLEHYDSFSFFFFVSVSDSLSFKTLCVSQF
jgi:hypothetical protein